MTNVPVTMITATTWHLPDRDRQTAAAVRWQMAHGSRPEKARADRTKDAQPDLPTTNGQGIVLSPTPRRAMGG